MTDESRGLYAGFEGYRSAHPEQVREAVQKWLVVLDTNVLLGLYAYQGTSLDDFMKVFEALEDRLFVPHQVLDEFWRNRRTVLKENRGRHRERETVEKAFAEAETALLRWHQRVVDRGNPPPPGVLGELQSARRAALGFMDAKNLEAKIIEPDTATYDDHVLRRLDTLLSGRVGPQPSPADRARLLDEGRKRLAAKVPPGYMDADKNPERAIGDFLVWHQTVEESTQRQLPVLLVTQDQKEDWWADGGSASMRARPELVEELLAKAGQQLLMLRSHDLLALGEALGVQVSQASVADAEEAVEELEEQRRGSRSRVGVLYKEFWTRFGIDAKERGWTTGTPPSANWWSMPAGGGGNQWSVSYAQFGCRSELYLGHPDPAVNLHRLNVLRDRQDEIELVFGGPVMFDELPHAQACRVELRIEDGRKIGDQDLWDDTLHWLVDTQDRLRRAIDSVGGVPLDLPA